MDGLSEETEIDADVVESSSLSTALILTTARLEEVRRTRRVAMMAVNGNH